MGIVQRKFKKSKWLPKLLANARRIVMDSINGMPHLDNGFGRRKEDRPPPRRKPREREEEETPEAEHPAPPGHIDTTA